MGETIGDVLNDFSDLIERVRAADPKLAESLVSIGKRIAAAFTYEMANQLDAVSVAVKGVLSKEIQVQNRVSEGDVEKFIVKYQNPR